MAVLLPAIKEKKTKKLPVWTLIVADVGFDDYALCQLSSNAITFYALCTLKQMFTLILTMFNLGIDSLTTFIPFTMVAGDELSLPAGT